MIKRIHNQYMNKQQRNYTLSVLLCILFVAQFLFFAYVNLTRTAYLVDHDSGALLRHTIAVAKNGSLYVKNWNTPSTLEWDSSLLVASALYQLTGNIFLSMGISNLLVCIGFVLVVYSIFVKLKLRHIHALIALTLIFTPYATGMLDYSNMLFLSAGQYGMKILIVLMLFSLMLTLRSPKIRVSEIILMLFYFPLLFITSVSSGSYVLLCGVLPCAVALLLFALFRLDAKMHLMRPALILLASFIVCVGGNLLCARLQASSATSAMQLMGTGGLSANISACLTGLLELFGAVGEEGAAVLSYTGLFRISRLTFVLLLSLFTIHAMRSFFQRNGDAHTMLACALCLSAFVVNTLVLLFSDTTYGATTFEYRYHLIGTLPLLLLPGLLWRDFSVHFAGVKHAIGAILLALMVFINFTGARAILAYRNNADGIEQLYARAQIHVEAEDADAIFFYTPLSGRADFQSFSLLAFSDDQTALRILEDGAIDLFNQSRSRSDYSDFGETNLIICKDVSALAPYIRSTLTLLETSNGYGIYRGDRTPIDGVSGLPRGSYAIDLPTSRNYTIGSTCIIDGDGSLVTPLGGGMVLCGPSCSGRDGVFDITLEYDLIDESITVAGRLYMTGESNSWLIKEAQILGGTTETTLQSVSLSSSMRNVDLRVFSDKTSLRIRRIIFKRII